jgi:UDP-glucose 4-epimerase
LIQLPPSSMISTENVVAESMKDKRVVVTGGAGFIGSNIADELAAHNQVIIIDDLSSGRLQNIEHLTKRPNVTFVQGSITDLSLVQRAFAGADYIFHQAALASVPMSIHDPLRTNEVNVLGTLNVLVAARDCHVKKVVFASSCAIYGDTPSLPARENLPPDPLSPYAVTKATGEQYCSVFRHVYGLPTVCLRYFNVYGPRQDPKSEYAAVVPKFVTAALSDRPPIVYGDGLQTRDFVFVKDVVSANISAAEANVTGAFNIGSGRQTNIIELANLILKLTGHQMLPLYHPPKPGEIRHSFADISRAGEFGYSPRHNLEQGIQQTISGMQSLQTQ